MALWLAALAGGKATAIKLQSAQAAGWEWTAERCVDWRQPFTDGLMTEYQRAGRKAAFLGFRKKRSEAVVFIASIKRYRDAPVLV